MLSMAAAGVLFWGRQKSKTQSVRALLRLLMLVHAAVPAVIRCVAGVWLLIAARVIVGSALPL
jgi:hypothetical protein